MSIAAQNGWGLISIDRSTQSIGICQQEYCTHQSRRKRKMQRWSGQYSALFCRIFCRSLLLCLLWPLFATAQEPLPWQGERGITESVRDIMARDQGQGTRAP